MRAAFYVATRPGLPGIYNRLVRWWEPGTCSHCELIFSDGLSGSASLIDGGVRLKAIDYDPANWIILDLGHAFDETYARQWFADRIAERAGYDLLGQFRFVLSPLPDNKRRYWCSESLAAALRLGDAWRFGPNLLQSILTDIVLLPLFITNNNQETP